MLLCGMDWKMGCMSCGIDHSSLALLLIALGVGAIVKHKEGGKILGYFIMIIAALGLVCSSVCTYKSKLCSSGKTCQRSQENVE